MTQNAFAGDPQVLMAALGYGDLFLGLSGINFTIDESFTAQLSNMHTGGMIMDGMRTNMSTIHSMTYNSVPPEPTLLSGGTAPKLTILKQEVLDKISAIHAGLEKIRATSVADVKEVDDSDEPEEADDIDKEAHRKQEASFTAFSDTTLKNGPTIEPAVAGPLADISEKDLKQRVVKKFQDLKKALRTAWKLAGNHQVKTEEPIAENIQVGMEEKKDGKKSGLTKAMCQSHAHRKVDVPI
ncbi:hypothetical protein JVU11DRAFT_8779 [Chiua virens]|nr:hypothetical protein JVU11DRAFT_8779 [Chiua virens]